MNIDTNIENHQEKIQKLTTILNDCIREFGIEYVAKELIRFYEQYREIACVVTHGQYKDNWTHANLMKFINEGEF